MREDTTPALDLLLERLRAAPVAPWSLELLSPALAAQLGVAAHAVLLVRLAGNGDSVTAQRTTLASLASTAPAASTVWDQLRNTEPAGAAVVRLSASRSQVSRVWCAARAATADWSGAFTHASLGRGVVR